MTNLKQIGAIIFMFFIGCISFFAWYRSSETINIKADELAKATAEQYYNNARIKELGDMMEALSWEINKYIYQEVQPKLTEMIQEYNSYTKEVNERLSKNDLYRKAVLQERWVWSNKQQVFPLDLAAVQSQAEALATKEGTNTSWYITQ